MPAQFGVIRAMARHQPPETRTVVPHGHMAEFMDNHVIEADQGEFDEIQVEVNAPGTVGIAPPAALHGADHQGWERCPFELHPAVAFDQPPLEHLAGLFPVPGVNESCQA